MKKITFQSTLTIETFELEQKTNATVTAGTTTAYNSGIKKKHEPIMTVSLPNGGNRKQKRHKKKQL